MYVIGLTGKKYSGKDTAADYIVQQTDGAKVASADILKDIAVMIFLVAREVFYDPELKDIPMQELYWKTPRYVLQTLGTQWGRMMIHQNIWVDHVHRKIETARQNGVHTVVLADIRYLEEVQLVQMYGGPIWQIVRGNLPPSDDAHDSEHQKIPVDLSLYNGGTQEELLTFYSQIEVALNVLYRPDKGPPQSPLSLV